MRPCQACTHSQVLYVTVPSSEKCEQCTRFGRSCDLTSLIPQLKRLAQEKDRILEKILKKRRVAMEADTVISRLRKQRRLLQKRIKKLGEKEYQNIFKLEMDKMLAENLLPKPSSEIFPPNPSQISLGSSHRTSATPLHSG
jgi:hypothetical protein